MPFKFLTEHQIEGVAVPVNTTGAAVAGDWISLKEAARLTFLILQGAWAGGTPAVTLLQATDASGTGSKALSFTKAARKTTLGSAKWTEFDVSSDTFNLNATANQLTAIEIAADQLDVDNDFCFVQLAIASPGSNADLIACLAITDGIREQRTPSLIPAATA